MKTLHVLCRLSLLLLACQSASSSPLALPCSLNSFPCGQPSIDPSGARIIGGKETLRGSWPWVVALYEDRYLTCGGTIISDDLVLTASHCFDPPHDNIRNWTVAAGMHRTDRTEPGQRFVKISRVIPHDFYNQSELLNDIALIQLSEKLPFSSLIKPVCLPDKDQGVSVAEMCLLAGWGVTRGTLDPHVLNQVSLPIIADDVCAHWYSYLYGYKIFPNSTFCAGYAAGEKDGCTGDSGGPLICYKDNSWYLQGISSWGFGCAQRYTPGVYTEVNKYSAWIKQKVSQIRACAISVG